MKNNYTYKIDGEIVTKQEMKNWFAANRDYDVVNINEAFSMRIANYDKAEKRMSSIMNKVRRQGYYMASIECDDMWHSIHIKKEN